MLTQVELERFDAFIGSLGLRWFKPYEFLVKGARHSNPHSPAFGLNDDPPEELWPNIAQTAKVLDEFRDRIRAPVTFTSVYRTKKYNDRIGGARKSQHMRFNAVDFVVQGITVGPPVWARLLLEMRGAGLFAGGVAAYDSFVHVDTRGENADWGD